MANAADLLFGQITSLGIRCSSAITPLSSSDEEEETWYATVTAPQFQGIITLDLIK